MCVTTIRAVAHLHGATTSIVDGELKSISSARFEPPKALSGHLLVLTFRCAPRLGPGSAGSSPYNIAQHCCVTVHRVLQARLVPHRPGNSAEH